MKKIILILGFVSLTGCSTIEKYWPRDHDPVMFNHLVSLDVEIERQDCSNPNWTSVEVAAEKLARYSEWRKDPQSENMRGLQKHITKLSQNTNKVFCDLGKKTAKQRINAAKSAWEKR